MRKSKALKALLVFGMSIATATSVAATAGCGHSHSYDENVFGKDATGHWRIATCEEHEGEVFDKADHVDADENKKCDVCGWDMDTTVTPPPEENHKHVWSETFDAEHADVNGHWHWCTADGHEGENANGKVAHVDANGDNECDICHYNGGALPEKFTELKNSENNILANSFLVSGTLPKYTSWGTKGLYTANNAESKPATDAGNFVEIKDGVASMTDTTEGGTSFIVDFGGNLNGTVEGYFDMTLKSTGNSWTPVQFFGEASDQATDKVGEEIFGFRTDGGKIKYRVNGGSAVAPLSDIASANATYNVYFSINTTSGKVSITINGKDFVKELDTKITSIKGLKFVSSDKEAKTVNVDNLAVAYTPVDLATYKEAIKGRITELDTSANLLKVENSWTLTDTTEGTAAKLTAAKATAEAAVDAIEATKETIDATYEAYETAVLAALKAEYKARLASAYPAGSYNTNKTAYDAEIAKQNTAIDGVTSISGFVTVYNTACDELDKIENDTAANTKNVTITVKSGDTTILTLNKKAGDNLTISDVKNEIKAPFGKQLVDLFEDSGFGTAVTSINMTVNEDTEYVYYAKFEDKVLTTVSLDVLKVPTSAPTEDTLINDIFYITSKTKQESAKMNSGTYTKQVSLTSGKATVSANSIKFTVESDMRITVVAGAKSDKPTVSLLIINSTGSTVTAQDIKLNDVAKTAFENLPVATGTATDEVAVTYTFILPAGTYYLGGSGGGAYIYSLDIAY